MNRYSSMDGKLEEQRSLPTGARSKRSRDAWRRIDWMTKTSGPTPSLCQQRGVWSPKKKRGGIEVERVTNEVIMPHLKDSSISLSILITERSTTTQRSPTYPSSSQISEPYSSTSSKVPVLGYNDHRQVLLRNELNPEK